LALERLGAAPALKRRAAIAYHLGKCAQERTEYQLALDQFIRSQQLYTKARYKPGIATAIHAIGQIYHYQDQYGQAREAFLDALELQEELGDVESVANTLERLALTTWGLQEAQTAVTYCHRSLKEWRRLGNVQGEARTLTTLAMIHHANGAYGEVLECSRQAIALQEASNDRTGLLVSYQNLGILLYDIGALDEAREAAEMALELAGHSGSKLRKMRCYHILGVIASARGDFVTARRFLGTAQTIAVDVGNRERLSDVFCALAENSLCEKDVVKAREYVDRAVTLMENTERNPLSVQARILAARISLEEPQADLMESLSRIELTRPRAGEHFNPDLLWQLWEVRGKILLKLGRPREACRLLMRSMDVMKSCHVKLPKQWKSVYLRDARRQRVHKALEEAISAARSEHH